ncbi:MAG: hypothetical protein Kow00128_09290 [Deltaproteobacteria bacterium]
MRYPISGEFEAGAAGGIAFLLLAALFALVLFPARGEGTEEYASRTGRECRVCHLDPAGGGELTPAGVSFRRTLPPAGRERAGTAGWRHAVHFLAGFLHLCTAVLWFGTILYVHLLLKPSYAAHGLPRGELIVGWGSIGLIALTGAVLILFRIHSPADLFGTRFGILLLVKIGIFLVMTGTAVIVTFDVGPRLERKEGTVERAGGEMTAEELSRFDGKEGRPAYFAFRGRIYDATGSRLWKAGSHVGRHPAGFDLTDALKQAPHGEEKFLSMPPVGALIAAKKPEKAPGHLRAFYFMTYFNLVLVFGVLLIIALWRWW